MRLTGEQRRVIRAALSEARRLGASPKVRKALVEALGVEANYTNPRGGDRDSVGPLQQRSHYGSVGRRRNVRLATRAFVRQAQPLARRYGSAGELAQAVQRSAFPARYQQRSGEAERILRMFGGGRRRGGTRAARFLEAEIPGRNLSRERALVVLDYFQNRDRPDSLLSLAQGLRATESTPTQRIGFTIPSSRRAGRSAGRPRLAELERLAKRHGLAITSTTGGRHVPGSYHYQGRAFDAAGPPSAMARFARTVARRYGPHLAELFYQGPGGVNIDNGRRRPRGFVSGHTDHVHVAV
jgi:hypothetical protein